MEKIQQDGAERRDKKGVEFFVAGTLRPTRPVGPTLLSPSPRAKMSKNVLCWYLTQCLKEDFLKTSAEGAGRSWPCD